MTREEAIKILRKRQRFCKVISDHANATIKADELQEVEAIDMAISALRPVSRETVEKVWRGCSDCARKTCVACKHFGWAPRHCVDCENQSKWAPWNFCPVCGKPLTDEAVQIVMERLEALKDEAKD